MRVFEPNRGVNVVVTVFWVPDGVELQMGMDNSIDVSRERVLK